MSTYVQLTSEQRYQIYALLKGEHTQTEIAEVLKVNKSTISRDHGLRGYRPKQADNLTKQRRKVVYCSRIPPHHLDIVPEVDHFFSHIHKH